MPFDSLGPEAGLLRDSGWPHRCHPGAFKAMAVPEDLPGDDRTAYVQARTTEVSGWPASNVIRRWGGDELWQSVKHDAAAHSILPRSQRGARHGKSACIGRDKAHFCEQVRTLGASDLHCPEAPRWIAGCQALRCERRADQLRAWLDAALARGVCNETISAGVRGLAASDSTLGFAPNGWGRRAANHLCIDRSTVLTLSSMHSHGYC